MYITSGTKRISNLGYMHFITAIFIKMFSENVFFNQKTFFFKIFVPLCCFCVVFNKK